MRCSGTVYCPLFGELGLCLDMRALAGGLEVRRHCAGLYEADQEGGLCRQGESLLEKLLFDKLGLDIAEQTVS